MKWSVNLPPWEGTEPDKLGTQRDPTSLLKLHNQTCSSPYKTTTTLGKDILPNRCRRFLASIMGRRACPKQSPSTCFGLVAPCGGSNSWYNSIFNQVILIRNWIDIGQSRTGVEIVVEFLSLKPTVFPWIKGLKWRFQIQSALFRSK